MTYAAEQLEAEAGVLFRWLEDVEESGAGNGFGPSVDAMLLALQGSQATRPPTNERHHRNT